MTDPTITDTAITDDTVITIAVTAPPAELGRRAAQWAAIAEQLGQQTNGHFTDVVCLSGTWLVYGPHGVARGPVSSHRGSLDRALTKATGRPVVVTRAAVA